VVVDMSLVNHRPVTRELSQLHEVLWNERRLLDLLLFRLVSVKLVLAADEKRFLAVALSEVERALEKIRVAELQRSLLVGRLSVAWNVSRDELTLGYLADWSPEPARTLFEDHRDACQALTIEIETVSRDNKRLSALGLNEVRELMELVVGPELLASVDGGAYTQQGGRQQPVELAYRVNEVL
jgi:hypothetical protein